MTIERKNLLGALGGIGLGYLTYIGVYGGFMQLVTLQSLGDVVLLVATLGVCFAVIAAIINTYFPTIHLKVVIACLNVVPLVDAIIKLFQEQNMTVATACASLLLPLATTVSSIAGWEGAQKYRNTFKVKYTLHDRSLTPQLKIIAFIEIVIFVICALVIMSDLFQLVPAESEELGRCFEEYIQSEDLFIKLAIGLPCLFGGLSVILKIKNKYKYILQVVPAIPLMMLVYVVIMSQLELQRLRAITVHPAATPSAARQSTPKQEINAKGNKANRPVER